MFEKIICAFDGSDHATTALNLACDMAGKYNATLHVVSVPQAISDTLVVGYSVVPIPPTPEAIEKASDDIKAKAQTIIDAHSGSKAVYHIKPGEPGHVIVEYANEIGSDLIIMGRRGIGNLGGLLVGSTTNKVSQLADCAVMTLK